MAIKVSIVTARAEVQLKEYTEKLEKMNVEELLAEFFSYLDYTETSDNDHTFNPITIGCCRIQMMQPLGVVLEKLREISKP